MLHEPWYIHSLSQGLTIELRPIWHHWSTDRTSSENFECSGSSRASNSEVRTSIGADQRQSALAAAQRIKFKILLLVANCINQRAPLYLQELCVLVSAVPGRWHLWSADQLCQRVNRCRLSSMQKRGFAAAGPMAWNDLPAATRVSIARNSNSSKIVIKTYLFNTVMKWRLGTISEQSIGSPRSLLRGRWRNKC